MKNLKGIIFLALAPNLASAHEGIDPASMLHTFTHFSETYGLLVALPVALAIALVLKRRRAATKPTTPE